MNTSIFFRGDFYQQADDLALRLERVEALWADRFHPSWTIFIGSPTLLMRALGEAMVAGVVAGLASTEVRDRLAAERAILARLEARPWFGRLPSGAQQLLLTFHMVTGGHMTARAAASVLAWPLARHWRLRQWRRRIADEEWDVEDDGDEEDELNWT